MCDTAEKSKSDLKSHIKLVHMEKNLKCKICDFKASVKYVLSNHVKTVHGEKTFFCEYCDYRTSQKNKLDRHLKSTGTLKYGRVHKGRHQKKKLQIW